VVIELLATLLLGQVPVPSVTVPPTSERTIVFTDRNRTYLIGVETGKVQYLDILPAPNPTPDDDDGPTPEPVPVTTPWKWATIILDRNDSGRSSWRDSVAIRDAAKAKNGTITFLGADEKDIDSRNLRSLITERGLPLLITWDADKKLIMAKKVETEAELLESMK